MMRRIVVIAMAAAAVFAAILGAASPAQDPAPASSPDSTPTVIATAPPEATPTVSADRGRHAGPDRDRHAGADRRVRDAHGLAGVHRDLVPRARGHRLRHPGHLARPDRRPGEGRRAQEEDREDQLRGEGRQGQEVLDLNFRSRLQGRERRS
jgi:hypothetical protein